VRTQKRPWLEVATEVAASTAILPPPPTKGGASRHYKLTTRTVSPAGATEITFDLRTPASGGGMPRTALGDGRYRATPLGLSARTKARAKVHYSLEVHFKFRNPLDRRLSSSLQDVFGEGTDMKKLQKKFTDFKTKVTAAYPYFIQVPTISVNETAKDSGLSQFRVELPPHTGLFCDDPVFWQMTKIKLDDLVRYEAVVPGGPGIRTGFFNRSVKTDVLVSAEYFGSNSRPPVMWMEVTGEDDPPPDRSITTFTVEFRPSEWLPQTLHEERTYDRKTAVEALTVLVTNGLGLLQLYPNTLAVVVDPKDGGLSLQSQKYLTDTLRQADLILRFSAPFKDFYMFDTLEATVTFPMNDDKIAPMYKKEPFSYDPLKDLYPLHLVTRGQAATHHHVAGLGWVSLLGLMTGANKFAGRPEWVEVSGEQSQLCLRLVDRWCRPVVLSTPVEFVLYLELVDLF
jgi:hypothetical protein